MSTRAENEDDALYYRDLDVAESLSYDLQRMEELASSFEQKAFELRQRIKSCRESVRNERWWELKSFLDDKTIDSLCRVSVGDVAFSPASMLYFDWPSRRKV